MGVGLGGVYYVICHVCSLCPGTSERMNWPGGPTFDRGRTLPGTEIIWISNHERLYYCLKFGFEDSAASSMNGNTGGRHIMVPAAFNAQNMVRVEYLSSACLRDRTARAADVDFGLTKGEIFAV